MQIKSEPVLVNITPKMIAKCFADMSEDGQACFFNHLHANVLKWKVGFEFQMAAIADSPVLTEAGRSIMRTFKEYGEIL